MKNDQIQTLNYCAHAIEDLNETADMLRSNAPESARVIQRLARMLQSSVKFIMPNCCNLVHPDELRQAHLDLVHLPFPCVAFEAPWEVEKEGPGYIGDFKQTPATKRIALCWEALPEYEILPGLNSILTSFPEGGVFVVPIYWGPEYKKWTVAMGGTFVPYCNEMLNVTPDEVLPATRIAKAAKMDAGQIKEDAKQFRAEPFYLLPEFFESAISTYGDKETAFAQIILDSHDETLMLVQACSVINCANITTTDIHAPAALNKKRQEKGKQPFFTYKVLQLSDQHSEASKLGTGDSHDSPRMHLRRGHLRRLESKVIWVRPSMVNAGSSAGVVMKDYALAG